MRSLGKPELYTTEDLFSAFPGSTRCASRCSRPFPAAEAAGAVGDRWS